MAWTAEDRRKYAPAIQEVLRRGTLVRLATAIDTIDPPAKIGRPRDWSTLTMLGALASGARRLRLAAAAGRPRLAAAPKRMEPVPALAAAGGAGPGAGRPGRLPPPRCGPQAAADDGDRRHTERQDWPTARAERVRRPQEDQGQEAGADGRYTRRSARGAGGAGRRAGPRRARHPGTGPRRPSLAAPRLDGPRLRRRALRQAPRPPRHRPRTRRHPRPAGLRGRAEALEGRADLRLPAALPPPARR